MSDTLEDRTANALLGYYMLICLVTLALAACCFCISFLLAKNAVANIQDSGFYFWSGPTSIAGASTIVQTYTAPSVWYIYQPGLSLALALAPAPTHNATISAIAIIIAGATSLPVLALRHRNRWFLQEVASLAAIAALIFGLYIMVPATPGSFTIDLKQQLLTEAGASGAQIQVTPDLSFVTVSQSFISLVPQILTVQNNSGASIALAQGDYAALNTLCNLAVTFINTHGNQA